MSRRKPPDEAGKLTNRQMAQRMRRVREAEEASKFRPPPRGPNYGRSDLIEGDERIAALCETMRAELAFAASVLPFIGVTEEQFSRWMERGGEAMGGGETSPQYAALFDEVRRAEAYVELMLRRLSLDAKGAEEKKTAKWLLERNVAHRYALKRDTSSGTDVVSALGDLFAAHEQQKAAELVALTERVADPDAGFNEDPGGELNEAASREADPQ